MKEPNEELKQIYKKISSVLKQLGISPNIEGYWLLRDSIYIYLTNNIVNIKITKDIYLKLSRKYHKKTCTIEKSIRRAIEKGWNNCDLDFANEMFSNIIPYNKDRPTNNEFISTVSEHLSLEI
ncbi:MAG: sporulation initiation factor Spo0A C-terminal domain-containing protein [Bacilli bacterium]|nr:sporulation initiation factor Spo0A C-terminal domain-containing protein [Bacilli bacterium]